MALCAYVNVVERGEFQAQFDTMVACRQACEQCKALFTSALMTSRCVQHAQHNWHMLAAPMHDTMTAAALAYFVFPAVGEDSFGTECRGRLGSNERIHATCCLCTITTQETKTSLSD